MGSTNIKKYKILEWIVQKYYFVKFVSVGFKYTYIHTKTGTSLHMNIGLQCKMYSCHRGFTYKA